MAATTTMILTARSTTMMDREVRPTQLPVVGWFGKMVDHEDAAQME